MVDGHILHILLSKLNLQAAISENTNVNPRWLL